MERSINIPVNEIARFECYENAYGLSFTEAKHLEIRRFIEEYSNKFGNRSEFGPINIPIPLYFLSEPATKEQVKLINEHETQVVADTAVNMQKRLLGVPIVEIFEPMTSLSEIFSQSGVHATFSQKPFHEACGIYAGKLRDFWVRDEFAKRLVQLGQIISNDGLSIHFEDAFRPVGVQEGLFKRRVDWTKNDHPDWSEDMVVNEARSKTAVTPRLASHKAGAAVDLRLVRDGKLIDIGHDYPDGGALVFLNTPFLTKEQWQNRTLLRIASHFAGLTMYVGEDWHLSLGDNLASLDDDLIPKEDYVAKYGPIKDFDRDTGEIKSIYLAEELDIVFKL